MSATWFGAAQAISGIALGATDLGRGWILVLIILGIAGAVAMAVLIHRSRKVWTLRPESELNPAYFDSFREFSASPWPMNSELVDRTLDVLKNRRISNSNRAEDLRKADKVWL